MLFIQQITENLQQNRTLYRKFTTGAQQVHNVQKPGKFWAMSNPQQVEQADSGCSGTCMNVTSRI